MLVLCVPNRNHLQHEISVCSVSAEEEKLNTENRERKGRKAGGEYDLELKICYYLTHTNIFL